MPQQAKAKRGAQWTTERQPASKYSVVPASSGGTARTGDTNSGTVLTTTATAAATHPRRSCLGRDRTPSATPATPATVAVARAVLAMEPPAGVPRTSFANRYKGSSCSSSARAKKMRASSNERARARVAQGTKAAHGKGAKQCGGDPVEFVRHRYSPRVFASSPNTWSLVASSVARPTPFSRVMKFPSTVAMASASLSWSES